MPISAYRPESFNLSPRKLRSNWTKSIKFNTKQRHHCRRCDNPTLFLKRQCKSGGGVCQKNFLATKINWLPQKRPFEDRKTNVKFIIGTQMSTNFENLVKTGPIHSEIFGPKSQFLGHLLRDDVINPVKMSVRPYVRPYVHKYHNQTQCSHKPNSGIC